jgi:hypothetical protein
MVDWGYERATITLPDELEEALEAYRRSQDLPLSLTALTQAALRKYLEKRGFLAPSSGHERYLAEAAEPVSGTVLADTGPLYAAVDPSDEHHERAQEDIRRLNSEGFGVAVAYPTLCECYSHDLYKLGAGWRKVGSERSRAPLF